MTGFLYVAARSCFLYIWLFVQWTGLLRYRRRLKGYLLSLFILLFLLIRFLIFIPDKIILSMKGLVHVLPHGATQLILESIKEGFLLRCFFLLLKLLNCLTDWFSFLVMKTSLFPINPCPSFTGSDW